MVPSKFGILFWSRKPGKYLLISRKSSWHIVVPLMDDQEDSTPQTLAASENSYLWIIDPCFVEPEIYIYVDLLDGICRIILCLCSIVKLVVLSLWCWRNCGIIYILWHVHTFASYLKSQRTCRSSMMMCILWYKPCGLSIHFQETLSTHLWATKVCVFGRCFSNSWDPVQREVFSCIKLHSFLVGHEQSLPRLLKQLCYIHGLT